MKNLWYYDSPVGQIGIVDDGAGISDVFIRGTKAPDAASEAETPLIQKAVTQFGEYFSGERKVFALPFSLHGTQFQIKVWNALLSIPYGETRSYGQIAAQIGSPKACRAVGLANNRNPVIIAVPCHRVIGKDGKLVGYGGGLHIKEALLNFEKENKAADKAQRFHNIAAGLT